MKYVVLMLSAVLLSASAVSAQEEVTGSPFVEPAPPPEAPLATQTAQPPPSEEDKRSPYYKKVKGWLWLEGVAGVASYDPDQFGTLSLGASASGAPKQRGPQYGFAVGTGFGGGFFLGWYYHQSKYTGYKLFKTGVEFQPTIRIPHVHIMFRVDLGLARMFDGNAWELTNVNNGGLDATFGVGLRIPVVRWVSIAASFDWSYIGLSMRGDPPGGGTRINQWVGGQMLAGTFALTFHFIGVRKD